MKQNRSFYFIFFALLFSLTGCQEEAAYMDSKEIPAFGWDKNNAVSFDYAATDTSSLYNIVADIRSNSEYPYQNFWLFIHSTSPDSVVFSDTLECVLADNYGKWIGKSSGSLYHLPVMFMKEIKFPKEGNYHFDLVQGMREDTLIGIQEIGIRIIKQEKQ